MVHGRGLCVGLAWQLVAEDVCRRRARCVGRRQRPPAVLETDRRASNRCLLVFNAVSRAFGDRLLKQYVVAQPDVLEESLTGDDTLLIMATDGLWDVISNQDAIGLVRVRMLAFLDQVPPE